MTRLFVGALSFEPRAETLLSKYMSTASVGDAVLLLDYGGSATSSSESSRIRARLAERVRSSCRDHGLEFIRRSCLAYSSRDLIRTLGVESSGASDVLYDVSCFTRTHVVGLASALARSKKQQWRVGYTIPESYGVMERGRGSGWRDTLVLPLSPETNFRDQGRALGLILWGGESTRMQLALDETQPGAGRIVVTRTPGRPDFHRAAMNSGRDLLHALMCLEYQPPRTLELQALLGVDGYDIEHLDVTSLEAEMAGVLEPLCAAAEALSVPIVLFPFGPKITIFAASLLLASRYGSRCWAIIPVHRTHSLDYSVGSTRSVFFGMPQSSPWSGYSL